MVTSPDKTAAVKPAPFPINICWSVTVLADKTPVSLASLTITVLAAAFCILAYVTALSAIFAVVTALSAIFTVVTAPSEMVLPPPPAELPFLISINSSEVNSVVPIVIVPSNVQSLNFTLPLVPDITSELLFALDK